MTLDSLGNITRNKPQVIWYISISYAELSCRSLQLQYSTCQGRSPRWRLGYIC